MADLDLDAIAASELGSYPIVEALVAAVRASIEALRELDENPDLAHPDAVWYGGAEWREALAPFGGDQ